MSNQAQSILLLRLSALGDIIHTLPAVVALANSLPAARIGWVVETPFADLVATVAPVGKIIPVATKRWRRQPLSGSTLSDLAVLRRELASFAAETSIDFQGLAKSALLGLASRARRRIGFARASVRERIATAFYTETVKIDPKLHVVEWNLALARAAGAAEGAPHQLDLSRFAADASGSLQSLAAHRPIMILPGAGRPEKQWNIERYAALADRLVRTSGASGILVAWGPGERHLADRIASGGAARLAPPTDLRQLAFLLKHARLVIGGDTGPLHLADALGTAVVGLYGPTNPRRNGPYSQMNHVVETFSTTGEMSDIPVEAVVAKAGEVLGS